jgi:hypothetical protein
MHAFRHRLLGPRHAAWLLWLALVLPLAQGMATWHAMSHSRADIAESRGGKALHASHCDLCLTRGDRRRRRAARPSAGAARRCGGASRAAARGSSPRWRPLRHAYLSRAPPLSTQ